MADKCKSQVPVFSIGYSLHLCSTFYEEVLQIQICVQPYFLGMMFSTKELL